MRQLEIKIHQTDIYVSDGYVFETTMSVGSNAVHCLLSVPPGRFGRIRRIAAKLLECSSICRCECHQRDIL